MSLRRTGQRVVSAGRLLARALGRPSVLGAAYLLALTVGAARGPLIKETERVLGDDTSRIEAWVNVRFAGTIQAFEATVAITALILGALLGGLAGTAIRVSRWTRGSPPLSRPVFLSASLALTVALHATILARAMIRSPQLYTHAFYDAGGLRARAQVFLTDVVGPHRADVACLVAAVLLLAPPWRLPALARAARAAAARAPWVGFVAAGFAAVAALALALPRPSPPRAPRERPNVLVLGADSFRDDALRPEVMPRLAALAARRGTRFSRAYVSLARTIPAWVTLATGRAAHHHGVRSMFPRWEDHAHDLDTLPGRLGRAGYATAVVSDYGGDVFSTVDLGFARKIVPRFDFREAIRVRGLQRTWPLLPFLHSHAGRRVIPTMRELPVCADADMLADDAIGALREVAGAPFFLTVFFSSPHAPYAAPAPYYRRFTETSYAGRYKYDKSTWVARDEKTSAEAAAHMRGLYLGTLASVDDAAGRILDELDRLGLADDTIVVILGDHGENLADAPGRFYGHGNHLFGDHDLQIPLVIADPRRPRPAVVPAAVSNADVAPTLYELTGVAPPGDMDGRSLVPALEGGALRSLPTFAETELWIGAQLDLDKDLRFPVPDLIDWAEIDGAHGDRIVMRRAQKAVTTVARHRMVRDGKWKLVYIPTATRVLYRLFDVDADPENLTDVAAEHPDIVARLKGLLWEWMLQDGEMEERRGYLAPKGIRIPEIDGDAR